MAQVNESRIFALYSTKGFNLFMDATLRQWRAGLSFNDAFASAIASAHGAGIAEATLSGRLNDPDEEGPSAHLRTAPARVGMSPCWATDSMPISRCTCGDPAREHAAGLAEAVIRSRPGEFAVSQEPLPAGPARTGSLEDAAGCHAFQMAAVTTVTSS
jgi:hypothetical protein